MEHRSLAPNLVISTDDNAGRNQLAGEPAPDVAQKELFKEKQMGRAVNCNDLELSTYLQALAEGYLPTFYSDTSQSAQSKSMSIASKSFRRGKKTVVFHGFPSLKMSRHSTENHGAELLTSWLEDSLVKTYQSPEPGPDWTAKGQGYGEKWLGLLGRYDPDTHSLKTAQCSLFEGLIESYPTLPLWGLMLAGELYPQPIPALGTEEIVSGYWPTPTVCGNYNRPGASATSGMGLASAVKMWPTPCARDYRYPGKSRMERTGGKHGEVLPQAVGGPLNPDWTEWLMGWPIGLTDLKPLETGRFREFMQQHSIC